MYKYTLVEQDEKIEKFHKERIEAFDNLEARLDNVKKLLRQGKIETIKHYRNNPNDFSVIIPLLTSFSENEEPLKDATYSSFFS